MTATDLPIHSTQSSRTERTPTEYPLPQPVKDVIAVLLKGAAKRKGTEGQLDLTDEPCDYGDFGRCFTRLGEPFTSIFAIVECGLRYENRDTDDEADEDDNIRDVQLQSDWNILCHIIPGFRDEMIVIAEQRKLRHGVCMQINSGVEHARGDDTSSIKGLILGYIHHDISVPLNPLISSNDANKRIRGWKHPSCAALLTPIELEVNDITSANVISGRIRVTAHQLPRFLYPNGHGYSEDNLDDGLFRGHLVLRVAKHIFCGPKSVFQPPGYRRGGRRPVHEIINMRKMTPRSLAYIAVQARFAISDVQEWHHIDRDFNYETFFWNLVDLLSGDEGKKVLEFYDQEVLGSCSNVLAQLADGTPCGPSAIDRIKEQRAERARLEAASGTL